MSARLRLCIGASHVPGCHHEAYMRHVVERFLAHPRTRDALSLALSQESHPIDPRDQAVQVLVYLARVSEQLDGCEAPCATPDVEALTDEDVDTLGEVASYLSAALAGTETR